MAMKKSEKERNEIKEFYDSLTRQERSRFLLWAQLKTGRGGTTLRLRLKDDGWTPSDREAIERGIQGGLWRAV